MKTKIPKSAAKLIAALRRQNKKLEAEIQTNRHIICATQEGRTQWNAAEIWKTNQELNKRIDALEKAALDKL